MCMHITFIIYPVSSDTDVDESCHHVATMIHACKFLNVHPTNSEEWEVEDSIVR